MNTIDHLRGLYRYNDWANRRLIVALKENEIEKARKILSHLLITEKEFYERLYGKDSTGFNFWPDMTLEEIRARLRKRGVVVSLWTVWSFYERSQMSFKKNRIRQRTGSRRRGRRPRALESQSNAA